MKTITQMRKAVEELLQQLGDIDAKCTAGDREYSDEEKKLIAQIHARVRDLKEKIKLQEESKKLSEESHDPPTKEDPSQGSGEQRRIEWGKENPDPDQFRSLGEMLMAVIRSEMPGAQRSVDPRLQRVEETRASGMNEGVGSEGGFLVPPNFSSQLIAPVWEDPEVLSKVNKISLTSGNDFSCPRINESSREDGSRYGGIRLYQVAEAGSKTPSKPDLGLFELKCKKTAGLIYLTDELMADVGALEGYIKAMFPPEFQFYVINLLINGTGAGQALGILNAGCLVSQAKESGQVAATVVTENIVKMYSRMMPGSLKNAVWHINQDVMPSLFTMGIQVGLGGAPIFMPAGGLSQSPYNTLLGRPIIPLEQCSTLGTVGDIIFADWSQYWAIDRGEIQQASSIHVRFVYDETALRFVYRFDGAPWRASAVTPHSGSSNTLSPFVVLATRS